VCISHTSFPEIHGLRRGPREAAVQAAVFLAISEYHECLLLFAVIVRYTGTVRVLHIINDLRVGGAETLFADLIPAQRTLGIDAEACALTPSGLFVERQLQESGVKLHLGPHAIRDPRSVAWIKKLAVGFDLVHVSLWPAQLWVAAANLSVPVVATEQNTFNRRRNSRIFRPLDRFMYGKFAHVVAVSGEAERLLLSWVPELKNKTSVIINGMPLERYASAAPLPLDVSGPLLVCAARLETQKDIPTLLDAMALLPEVSLALAGDGPLRSALEAQAARLNLGARVRFLGRIEDIPGLLARADVYVQPSLYEGFPRATGEAIAAGLPVVVSEGPGFIELVGECALRFPVGDAPALARAVRQALDERAVWSARSRERAPGLSIRACAQSHLTLYEALIAPHKI
jgi:glycosyltransferase involved in cell wall biosynthesis